MSTVVIEEKAKDVKCILSVYEEYTVLAFRYTATIKNVAQDILWAFQVDFKSNLGQRLTCMPNMQSPEGIRRHVEYY